MRTYAVLYLAGWLLLGAGPFRSWALEQSWEDPARLKERLTLEQLEETLARLGSPRYAERARARERLIERADLRVLMRLYRLRHAAADPEIRHAAASLVPEVLKKLGGVIFTRDFLVLGPFPFPAGLRPRDYQPRRDWLELPTGLDKLALLDLSAKVPVDAKDKKSEKIEWKRPLKGQRGTLDLVRLFPKHKLYANAFLLTFLYSERPAKARLWLGSDDGIAAWLNGKNVLFHDIQRSLAPDAERVDVMLKAGWNPLVMRVSQGWGAWTLTFRVSGGNGRAWPAAWVDPAAGGEQPRRIPAPRNTRRVALPSRTGPRSIAVPVYWKAVPDPAAGRAGTEILFLAALDSSKKDGDEVVFRVKVWKKGTAAKAIFKAWRAGFQDAPVEGVRAKIIKTSGKLEASVLNLSGTRKPLKANGKANGKAEDKEEGVYGLLGAVAVLPEQILSLELSGPAKAVEARRAAFERVVASLK